MGLVYPRGRAAHEATKQPEPSPSFLPKCASPAARQGVPRNALAAMGTRGGTLPCSSFFRVGFCWNLWNLLSLYPSTRTTHFHERGNSRKRFQRFHRSISGRLMRNVAHRAPAPERVDQLEQGSELLPDRPTPRNRAVAILWALRIRRSRAR